MSCNTCGDCVYYTGEECNGPGGSSEGSVVYNDTEACEAFEKYKDQQEGVKVM